MAAKRSKTLRGATEPRLHSPYLKGKSKVDDVIELATLIKMPLLPWQEFCLRDMLKVDAKGNWIRKQNLLLVSRQQGKTHLTRMVILGHLLKWESKNIIIASSNRSMALDTFRQVASVFEQNENLMALVKAIRYANGTESIEMKDGTRLDVVAATRDGSRGRSACALFLDEVREWSSEAYRAAMPVTRARPNAHTFLTSNAGDAFSTVLNELRERALDNPPKSFGFYEYSAPQYCKIDDPKAWAMANPALGYTTTLETLADAVATSPIENTRTELLCQWIDSLSSPWPHGILEETSDSELQIPPGGYTVFGFDVSPSRRNASLVAGQLLPDGRIGVGILQTWESAVSVDDLKIAADIKAWVDKGYRPRQICYDKYTTQSIADKLTNAGCITADISGQQFYQACGDLLDGLVNHRVVHNGQANLIQQMNNCAAKVNDSAWRIVKRKSAGDVSAPIALAMVVSMLMKPQQVAAIYTE
jgi:phage terminase large subunit-like protein